MFQLQLHCYSSSSRCWETAKGPFGPGVKLPSSHCPFHCRTSSRKAVNTKVYAFWFDQTENQTRVYRFSRIRFIHSTTDRCNTRSIYYLINNAKCFVSRLQQWELFERSFYVELKHILVQLHQQWYHGRHRRSKDF